MRGCVGEGTLRAPDDHPQDLAARLERSGQSCVQVGLILLTSLPPGVVLDQERLAVLPHPAGEPFPETVGVLLARWAWRYRSELAPLGVTAGLVAAAWWLHHTRPHWWPLLAVLTGVAAWAVALFGARWRFPTRIERIYAAATIYVGGTWLSAATAALSSS